MPFAAEVRNGDGTWHKVDITTMRQPKIDLLNHELRCPDEDCHAPVIIRHGQVITPHFAHKANQGVSSCIFMEGGGESVDHQLGKRAIIRRLRQLPHYEGAIVEPERILRGYGIKRVADVYVEFPDGGAEVHEIQLARTTLEECQARTDDYRRLGVDTVIWWFGGANRNESSLRQWALHTTGLVGALDFEDKTVTVNENVPVYA